MNFLYQTLVQQYGASFLAKIEVPGYISENLKFDLRPYQREAFQRLILFQNQKLSPKPQKPIHLLYNMATGSGKTLIMAGLILYYYRQGFRNFLFFVNSNNIINKTKDNFLNPNAFKYLFRENIIIDNRVVKIKEVYNFENPDIESINIKFTTIQQLHIDLTQTKENGIGYDDFEHSKTLLIADEAHHLSTATKNAQNATFSWENTVMKVLKQNENNMLFEFTATLDYHHCEIVEKYKDKVLFKYDLSQFRTDGYSKEINLIQSHYSEPNRILQAIILSEYRQALAICHGINLKPVVLFKAKKTIKESEQNMDNFHRLIHSLTCDEIEHIRQSATINIVQQAFLFFKNQNISTEMLVARIKFNFKEQNCVSANNDKETEKNQLLLNTLEDNDNPIRAVFAVHKLNEGWDVLNLFDIVRLYSGTDGRKGSPGKTTLSEAQLIGRGARYFPFTLKNYTNKFTRKFDNNPNHHLRVLEELYYHTREDNQYISELKNTLIQSGIYQDIETKKTKQPTPSPKIKAKKKNIKHLTSLTQLNVFLKTFNHVLDSSEDKISNAFIETSTPSSFGKNNLHICKKVSDVPPHIVRFALSQNPFFNFHHLKQLFPPLNSLSEFINNPSYLSNFTICFKLQTTKKNPLILNSDYLKALQGLLHQIETELKHY